MSFKMNTFSLLFALAVPQSGPPPPPPPPPTIAVPQTATPQQQTVEPLPNGALSGVVVDGSTGAAVPNAIVYLSASTPRLAMGPQTRQLTDDKGRFAFVNLPGDSTYTITASKFGYLDGGYGREKAPSDPLRSIPLKTDEWNGSLRVAIWKPGAISGVVRDEGGDPVIGVFVRALVRYRMQGRDELAAGPMTVTDDRGAYRLSGLQPGRYVIQVPSVQASMPAKTSFTVAATNAPDGGLEVDETTRLVIGRYPLPPPPMNGRSMAYPIAFYPSTGVVSDATTIELKYGDDRPNVDIRLTPVPAARVSGIVEGPPEAMNLLTVRLLPAGLENLGHGSEAATALVDASGQFTFLNVPAGTYTLDAPFKINEFSASGSGRPVSFPPPPGTQGWGRSTDAVEPVTGLSFSSTNFRSGSSIIAAGTYSARGSLTVGASDLAGVVIRLKPSVAISGKIVVENDPAQPAPATPPRFTMVADPAGGEASLGLTRAPFQQDAPVDQFLFPAVMPGQYWIRLPAGSAWLVKSIAWKGRDYTATPFDTSVADDFSGVVVTVTNARPTLSGSVRGTDTLKPEDCSVVVFPADRTQWRGIGLLPTRLKSAPVSSAGAYQMSNLPAGDYLVAAISRTYRPTWQDPAFLAELERSATRITLRWGAKTSQDVAVTVIR